MDTSRKELNMWGMDRNSNMEILRVAALFLIIMYNYAVRGQINYSSYYHTDLLNGLFIQYFAMGGRLGGMIFICLFGYHQINRSFSLTHLLRIMFELIFYSFILYVVFCMAGTIQFSFRDFVRALFPTLFERWWFALAYIVIYCLTPFLNGFLNSLSKQRFTYMLVLLVIMWLAIPTVTLLFDGTDFYGQQFPVYILVYSTGAYLARFRDENAASKGRKLVFISLIVMLASVPVFNLLGDHIDIFRNRGTYLAGANSIFNYTMMYGLVLMASAKEEKVNPFINTLAGTSLGIYLLVDNEYMRRVFWRNLFSNSEVSKSVFFVFIALLSCIAVYVMCFVVEFIRKATVEKAMGSAFIKLEGLINGLIDKIKARADSGINE